MRLRPPKITKGSWPGRKGYGPDWKMKSDACRRRAGYKCEKCGWAPRTRYQYGLLHAHHIVSKSKGGLDTFDNLICLCRNCHADQHDHMKPLEKRFEIF